MLPLGNNNKKTIIDLTMNIQAILQRPHPFIFNRNSVLLPSLITFLVLVILKPFEFDTFQIDQLFFWSFIFAIIVGATIFCCVMIVKRYFRKAIEDNWTVKNEILLILFVLAGICVLAYALFLSLNPQIDKLELFYLVVLRTLAIGFFPVLAVVLYEQNHYLKLRGRHAERLNQELLKKENSISSKYFEQSLPGKISLLASNKKVALLIDPMDLVFTKAEGNYVEIFYYHAQKVKKELIRNSLKAIESQLPVTDFFRCHKSFVVNLNYIQKVEGNARNLELVLENIEEKIPVSRNKSDNLLQLFQEKA